MKYLLPASILLGSFVIAGGLYFGLRASQPTPPVAAPTPAPSSAATRPESTPPAPVDDDRARADASAAIEAARPTWRTLCWDTADPATRKPGRYVAALAFSPEGSPTIAGVNELRDHSDFEIARCLRKQIHAIRIPPPGRPLSLEIPFELP